MRRTKILLISLGLLAVLLFGLKLVMPTPKTPVASEIGPTPAITAPSPTSVPVTPTPSLPSYQSSIGGYALTYPDNWHISNQATGSAQESWTLSARAASSSATAIFTLKRSSSLPSLTCPTDSEMCQATDFNGYSYQIKVINLDPKAIKLNYTSVADPYVITINTTFTGEEADLLTLISTWNEITESFTWSQTGQTPGP